MTNPFGPKHGTRKKNKKRKKSEAYDAGAAFKKRLPWMTVIILGLFTALLLRAFYIQVINRDFYQEKAEKQWTRNTVISAAVPIIGSWKTLPK